MLSRIVCHAAEFINPKKSTEQPHSFLGKNRIPFRGKPHSCGDHEHGHGRDNQHHKCNRDIQNSPAAGEAPNARGRAFYTRFK